jgi:Cu+-exporting ATPase
MTTSESVREFAVTGMTCASCVMRVEKPYAKSKVSARQPSISPTSTPSFMLPLSALITAVAAVEKAGYGAIREQLELPITGMTCASCSALRRKSPAQTTRRIVCHSEFGR